MPSEWVEEERRTDITEEEMGSIFSLYLARSICIHEDCCSTRSFAEDFAHVAEHHSGHQYSKRPSDWTTVVGKVVKETGLDPLTVSEEEMELLGGVFECRDCSAVLRQPIWPASRASVLPIRATNLTWSDLVSSIVLFALL